MRVVGAFPREPATPSVKLRPRRFHAVEVSPQGRLAEVTLCALLASGLDFGPGSPLRWDQVRRGRCPVCSAMVEHRAIQGDLLEARDLEQPEVGEAGRPAQPAVSGAVSIRS